MKHAPVLLSIVLTLSSTVSLPGADVTMDPLLSQRMSQLEAETQALRAEVQRLRTTPVRLPDTDTNAPGPAVVPASTMAPPPEPPAQALPSMDQFRAEMKKLTWAKGDFSVTPYGFLWPNMVYSTQRTVPGSYTLWAQSFSAEDESEFVIDARNTRLGLDVTGPRIPFFCCATSGGKVEIDFQQSFPNVFVQENKGTLLLRHAYWEVKNDEFRLLAGQTWDVVSPLLPGMIMYSVGWDAGNIGYRRAQFRFERYLAFSDASLMSLQASLNQNVFEDVLTNFRGEPSSWPIVEARLGMTLGPRGKGEYPITCGISGHIGEEEYHFTGVPALLDQRRSTWSLNADLRVPFTPYFGFQAEFFTGENLGAFLGGIGQGVNLLTGQEIHSTGGWCELWYDWTPCLHSHVGYGIDDPNNDEVPANGRIYNDFIFANCIYDFTKNFNAGIEVSYWQTHFQGLLPGDSVRTEFVMKYGF